MRRFIFAVALTVVFITPAHAHIPEECEPEFAALVHAYGVARMAHDALDGSDAGESLENYVWALRESVAAGIKLARCVDEN